MDVNRLDAQAASTVTAEKSAKSQARPNARFPEHRPLPLPSVTSITGQACFHSFVALSLVFASAMLWAATFGELPMFVKPPTHCVQYDFGPAGSADRLSR